MGWRSDEKALFGWIQFEETFIMIFIKPKEMLIYFESLFLSKISQFPNIDMIKSFAFLQHVKKFVKGAFKHSNFTMI